MKYCHKLISILLVIVFLTSVHFCSQLQRNVFREEKEVIEKDINSMLLGNYLRKLMLKVNLAIS